MLRQTISSCDQNSDLLQAFQYAVLEYSKALGEISPDQGPLRFEEYVAMCGRVRALKEKCEKAKLALQKHITEHHCSNYGPIEDAEL